MADPTEIVAAPRLEFSPAAFDPNKESLHAIAAEVAQITADPAKMTKEDFDLVNATKNKLVKARTTIQKRGKELREDAIRYQRDVIGYEKELIAIIEPEEARLKEIEAKAKEYAMTQERLKTLPEFKEKLAAIGDDFIPSDTYDEFLLTLDPNGRTEYYNGRLGAKLEADKVAADARQAEEDAKRAEEQKKLDDERAEIEREKERLAAEEDRLDTEKHNARLQRVLTLGYRETSRGFEYLDSPVMIESVVFDSTDEDFEASMKIALQYVEEANKRAADAAEAKRLADIKSAEEAATKVAEDKAAADRAAEEAEKEKRAAEEKAAEEARARETAYQEFLKAHSYDEATDTVITDASGLATLYRKVAAYQHPTA